MRENAAPLAAVLVKEVAKPASDAYTGAHYFVIGPACFFCLTWRAVLVKEVAKPASGAYTGAC